MWVSGSGSLNPFDSNIWIPQMLYLRLAVRGETIQSIKWQSWSILSWLLPEVAPKVGHNIVVHAFLHHEDFLLYDGKVIPWKQREKSHRHMDKKLYFHFLYRDFFFHFKMRHFPFGKKHLTKRLRVWNEQSGLTIHLQNLHNKMHVSDTRTNL